MIEKYSPAAIPTVPKAIYLYPEKRIISFLLNGILRKKCLFCSSMVLQRSLIFLLAFMVITSSFIRKPASKARIVFEPCFENEPLVLVNKMYKTSSGDSLFIDLFKFYMSTVSFKIGGKWHPIKKSYYLVNAEEATTQTISLELPNGTIDSLKFLIGVDSITCVSGNMEGDLDPIKAMYWSWNTGYVNAKIEGRSNSCKTIHNVFEFHIGGYMAPFNTLKTVSLKTGPGNTFRVKVKVDRWFNGKEKIHLSNVNSIVTPGKEAVMMANNYKNMFEIFP
jgi:hypothetical protein